MGSVIGPIIGASEAQANRDAADQARQQALGQWTGISAPSLASQQLNFNQYQNAGDLTNQLEQAQALGPSAMQGIQTDPRLAQAQMAALQQLSQVGQMGMTPAEAAALSSAQQNAAAQAQAKSRQIEDEFARRGMGGSGAELAARLSGAQNAAQMLSNNSNQIAQNAQQNALQALSQSGSLAGQMNSQQFGQQAAIAQAKDYINQFNLQNSQNVSNQNAALKNQATARNLTNAQNLATMNTQLGNQQQQANKALIQQQYNNQMALASGRAGQYQGIAQNAQQNAANVANMYAGIGRGVDTGVGSIYTASQRNNPGDNQTQDTTGGYGGGYGGGNTMGSYGDYNTNMAGGSGDQQDASEAASYFA